MGKQSKRWILLAGLVALLTPVLHAVAQAGNATANLYQSNLDAYVDERVDIEISHVKIIPAVKGIEGLAFIFASTYDFENHCDGGEMLVIVKAEDAERLRRKYGTIMDMDASGEPETKRMRGTLRLVGDSMLFMEYDEKDEIFQIVQAHYDTVKSASNS